MWSQKSAKKLVDSWIRELLTTKLDHLRLADLDDGRAKQHDVIKVKLELLKRLGRKDAVNEVCSEGVQGNA